MAVASAASGTIWYSVESAMQYLENVNNHHPIFREHVLLRPMHVASGQGLKVHAGLGSSAGGRGLASDGAGVDRGRHDAGKEQCSDEHHGGTAPANTTGASHGGSESEWYAAVGEHAMY